MGRLVLVRHGNTFDPGDTPTRVGARTDLSLSASGRAQAGALAAHFAPAQFAAACASTLARTRETARHILSARTDAPALLIQPFLTEIDYGPDENQTEAAVIARIGTAAITAWDTAGISPPDWHIDRAAIRAGWQYLAERIADIDGAVLVVTSNGIARLLPEALAIDAAGLDLKLKTGAFSLIDLTPAGARVAAWNLRP
jgi:broad specificity phosphatase PhoE